MSVGANPCFRLKNGELFENYNNYLVAKFSSTTYLSKRRIASVESLGLKIRRVSKREEGPWQRHREDSSVLEAPDESSEVSDPP